MTHGHERVLFFLYDTNKTKNEEYIPEIHIEETFAIFVEPAT